MELPRWVMYTVFAVALITMTTLVVGWLLSYIFLFAWPTEMAAGAMGSLLASIGLGRSMRKQGEAASIVRAIATDAPVVHDVKSSAVESIVKDLPAQEQQALADKVLDDIKKKDLL